MNKTDHIQYWKRTAVDSWTTTEALFSTNRNVESVFWAHLTLEKLLKAHWVQDNMTNAPPRVHNLKQLSEETTLVLDNDQKLLLLEMNAYQMESRYPDYSFSIEKICTTEYTDMLLTKVETLKTWLLNQLP
jgi:HEPN domain-containing protein